MSTASNQSVVIAALYKFVQLDDYKKLQPRLLDLCKQQQIKGTLLLAQEGINGTIAGPGDGIDAVLDWLKTDPRLADVVPKKSFATKMPFLRMKVKLKQEIVTMGLPNIDPGSQSGEHIEATEWNQLLNDPEVLLLDTRNRYETAIGSFSNAVKPEIDTFREFPEYVAKHLNPQTHKKIAMFCTGGIRCEKASAYMLQQGFERVYQLHGGILKYLATVTATDSLWQGECFVFDERVAVDHDLAAGSYAQCYACRHPLSEQDRRSPHYQPGVACPHCHGQRSAEQTARASERHKQVQLAKARQQPHLGVRITRPAKQSGE